MKKIAFIIALAFVIFSGCTKQVIEQNKETEVYFTNLHEELTTFIDSANKTVYCAFYDISDGLAQKLIERSKTIDVKLVMEDQNKKINGNAVKYDGAGLMHNKFCIADNSKVWTGSYNPSDVKSENDNNALIIYSKYIASDFEDEFFEMWGGKFKSGAKTKYKKILLNNSTYRVYFCPEDSCAENLLKELKSAEKSIYFLTFSFTRKDFADALIEKKEKGLVVKGVIEKQRLNESYGQYNYLKNKIEVVPDKNPKIMHNKIFIIDEKIVATGSFNPTYSADKYNDENLVIIEDESIAKKYLDEFNKLYQ
jgi:phosphatidylserine/phosphatidylglycerophosphate/cardiolipin synthase-like enzyme